MSKIINAVFKSDINYLMNNLNSQNVDELDQCGRSPLIHACIDKQKEIVELLLKKKAQM